MSIATSRRGSSVMTCSSDLPTVSVTTYASRVSSSAIASSTKPSVGAILTTSVAPTSAAGGAGGESAAAVVDITATTATGSTRGFTTTKNGTFRRPWEVSRSRGTTPITATTP